MIGDLIIPDELWSTLIAIAIILGVCFIIAMVAREKHMLKVVVVILCVGWLGLGIYSGFSYFTFINTTSEVHGSPEIHDPYEDFNFFEYDLGNIVWYQQEDGGYAYTETYNTSVKFQGGEDKYILLVNDKPCNKTSSANGRLHGELIKQFRDLDGQVTDTFNFDIDFTFESSVITVAVSVDATPDNIGVIREFVSINGFDLRIINNIYN